MSDGIEGGSSTDGLTSSTSQDEQKSDTAADATSNECNVVPRCNCISERLGCIPDPGSSWSCEDDPPPYASLVGAPGDHHRVAWSYAFPGAAAYEDGAEGRTIARPLVSIPLTSYGIFKIEPPRYSSAVGQPPPQYPRIVAEAGPAVKTSTRTARKYGAILIAGAVILFLMALSLMVRFITEKSLWRG